MRSRGFQWCPHCRSPHSLGNRTCPRTGKSIDNTLHERRAHPLTGTVVGGSWRILRHLGSGGMGDVFEAENLRLHRRAALKFVKSTASSAAAARLQREAELLATLHHPNICGVYDIGVMNDGTPFLVLELLTGQTLAERIMREGPLPLPLALDAFTQILSALHSAHTASVIHRDLKPRNVFLTDRVGVSPVPKLMDFGLAKDVSGVRSSITVKGKTVGTTAYMAPEQLRGEPVDARADIFSAGVTLFESLTGEHPFGRDALDIQVGILREAPASLLSRRPNLPPAVGDVIAQALAKDRRARFATALAMQSALLHAVARAV